MVKRCSAKNCYNSQLTHKIAYFGFPKNDEVARKWANLAGREDLVEKRLENLTKYYLCSDHFTSKDFIDPNVEDKSFLRLNKLYAIPLPSVFEDNLMKNVKSVCQNPQKFVNYTKNTTNEKSPKQRQIPLPRPMKPPSQEEKVDNEDEMCVEYIDESLELQNIESQNMTEATADLLLCRLCAYDFADSGELFEIFNDQGQFYEDTECLRLMPQGLITKNDGGPQLVCQTCLEKLQSCANIIHGFVMNQNLFAT